MGAIFSKNCTESSKARKSNEGSKPVKRSSLQRNSVQNSKGALNHRNVSKMTIQEDSILETLCEMTNIEPSRTSQTMKVMPKERKKLFEKFSEHNEVGHLFKEEEKMKEFIKDVSGYSEKDKEIDENIRRSIRNSKTGPSTLNQGLRLSECDLIGGSSRSSRGYTAPERKSSTLSQQLSAMKITSQAEIVNKRDFNVLKELDRHREHIRESKLRKTSSDINHTRENIVKPSQSDLLTTIPGRFSKGGEFPAAIPEQTCEPER